ncbi:unnamed protein product, partial [Soboliphyme baturini]|uniref:Nuclear pore protein n=1 Tax=Soboliphyme baturini TaxID=241478 RepID=A0A183IYG4_9BILA
PGLASNFKLDSTKLVEFVAEDAVKRSSFETAVKLYDLAEDDTRALNILSDLLSEVASLKISSNGRADRIVTLARDLNCRYGTFGHSATPESFATFSRLLDLVRYFERYNDGSYAEAINIKKLMPDILTSVMTILLDDYRKLKNNAYFSTNGGAELADNPKEMAKALVTYAGQVPYHFPGALLSRLVQAEISML